MAIESGKLMIHRINDLINSRENFAFETTLSSKSYLKRIQFAKSKEYKVTLLFLWLRKVELAKERVIIAEKSLNENLNIINELLFYQLKRQYESGKQN